MTKPATNSSNAARIAVIHHQADSWILLCARQNGTGPIVELAQALPHQDTSGVTSAIARYRPDAILCVIPASRMVVRPVMGENGQAPTLPSAADPSQFQSSMDLIAESVLGSSVEPHRRAGGVLRVADAQLPVALGWLGKTVLNHPVRAKELGALGKSCTYVPEALALAALMDATPGATLGLATDRLTGSVSILSTADTARIRTLTEDGDDGPTWAASISQAVQKVAPEASGFAAAATEPAATTRLANERGERLKAPQIKGAGSDPAWLDQFGITLGALLAFSKPTPATLPLLALAAEAPVPDVPILVRIADWFSKPVRGIATIAACLTIMLAWPLGVAYARYTILSEQAKTAGTDDSAVTEARRQADLARMLKDRRWPMTKLLSDLTATMPAGITLESLDIQSGNPKVQINGTADTSTAVSEWREALDKSRVFDQALVTQIEATTNQPGKFVMNVRVAQQLLVIGSADKGLESVLLVKPPSATPPPTSEPDRPADKRASGGDKADKPAANKGRNNRNAKPEKDAVAADGAPAPISDDEIAQLDRSAAMREFAARNKASKSATDPAVVERLKAEAAKCQEQMKRAGGGQ